MTMVIDCAGDWHRAVHVWLHVAATGEVLLQRRAACKECAPPPPPPHLLQALINHLHRYPLILCQFCLPVPRLQQ